MKGKDRYVIRNFGDLRIGAYFRCAGIWWSKNTDSEGWRNKERGGLQYLNFHSDDFVGQIYYEPTDI